MFSTLKTVLLCMCGDIWGSIRECLVVDPVVGREEQKHVEIWEPGVLQAFGSNVCSSTFDRSSYQFSVENKLTLLHRFNTSKIVYWIVYCWWKVRWFVCWELPGSGIIVDCAERRAGGIVTPRTHSTQRKLSSIRNCHHTATLSLLREAAHNKKATKLWTF